MFFFLFLYLMMDLFTTYYTFKLIQVHYIIFGEYEIHCWLKIFTLLTIIKINHFLIRLYTLFSPHCIELVPLEYFYNWKVLTGIRLPGGQDSVFWREFKANCLWKVKGVQQVLVSDTDNIYSGFKRNYFSNKIWFHNSQHYQKHSYLFQIQITFCSFFIKINFWLVLENTQ